MNASHPAPSAEYPRFPVKALKVLLELAFAEDEGTGDVTSLATLNESDTSTAILLAKDAGVLAGLPVIGEAFRFRGLAPSIETLVQEGERFMKGQHLARIHGPTRDILLCERIMLNLLQRLSGIATATRRFVDALQGSPTRILDTRKTPPGYRDLDKYSVAVGGGKNHRRGLYDQILIKDNHAAACGGVVEAVRMARARYGGAFPVECEVRTLEELQSLFGEAVDIVLLDNMSDDLLRKAVSLARGKMPQLKLEASGNMDLARVAGLRNAGLDFISVGALTHSVKALDLSLDIIQES